MTNIDCKFSVNMKKFVHVCNFVILLTHFFVIKLVKLCLLYFHFYLNFSTMLMVNKDVQ